MEKHGARARAPGFFYKRNFVWETALKSKEINSDRLEIERLAQNLGGKTSCACARAPVFFPNETSVWGTPLRDHRDCWWQAGQRRFRHKSGCIICVCALFFQQFTLCLVSLGLMDFSKWFSFHSYICHLFGRCILSLLAS